MAIDRDITAGDDWFTGEDKLLSDTIFQGTTATPQDISGWAISFMIKRDARDADIAAKVTKTVGSGVTLTAPLLGQLSIAITDDDTSALKAGNYAYEIKRTDPGSETVLTRGTLTLRQGVHR